MNCPKCLGKLEEHIIDKIYPVGVCFVCHGVWFDKDELKGVIKDGNDLLSDDVDEDADYEVPEDIKNFLTEFSDKVVQCPKCQDTTMIKKKYSGVFIDACPKCGGIWLDPGEILKVRHHEWKDFIECIPSLMFLVKLCIKHPFGFGLKNEVDKDFKK